MPLFFYALDIHLHATQRKEASLQPQLAFPTYLSITHVLLACAFADVMSYPGSSHPASGYTSAESSLIIPRTSSFGVLRRESWVPLFTLGYQPGF